MCLQIHSFNPWICQLSGVEIRSLKMATTLKLGEYGQPMNNYRICSIMELRFLDLKWRSMRLWIVTTMLCISITSVTLAAPTNS
ncbi:hypothetical protein OUZ56_030450 [Daphnia magna]|uniref:Uncharacterized protein n=1 Tax=Daphnia magna TaxID=35525 RepID=A0ABQ9ZRB8_9CRUS|nr:hypothetical protein OUZ56_030450 [Daphnia magna]